jgi:tetratricopeptide (TPR) repeat protein
LPALGDLLSGAPRTERSLLELRATWRDLPEPHGRVAARLRVFVLNWDPLHGLGEPFGASATATGDGDSFELVLYGPLDDGLERLGDLCRSVLDVAVDHELLLVSGAYAQLASAGKVPGLLSAVGALSAIAPPEFEPAARGWEPIGLGAIQDLAQARFGPVDLDRAAVSLDAVTKPDPRCPACRGQRFGFPAALADAQAAMCPPHAGRAEEITAERLARAEASNRDGWLAIVDASSALSEPTYGLRLDLLDGLEAATDRIDPTPEELRADAARALELARELRGRPDDFEAWAEDWPARDWMLELPWTLARHEMVDDAVRVADAFADLDREQRPVFAGDAGVMLAEAGRADEARARVAANLKEFPRDIWIHVHAGDVHRILGDLDAAEREFRHAAALAQAHGDREDRPIIGQRLSDLLATMQGREPAAGDLAWAKIGRNDPCPCGSGRKYKKCCGV